jgi:hypothetical protein
MVSLSPRDSPFVTPIVTHHDPSGLILTHRGLAYAGQLDRSAFTQRVVVPALKVPRQHCDSLCRKLKKRLLSAPKTRTVVAAADSTDLDRLVLLNPTPADHAWAPDEQQLLQATGAEVQGWWRGAAEAVPCVLFTAMRAARSRALADHPRGNAVLRQLERRGYPQGHPS